MTEDTVASEVSMMTDQGLATKPLSPLRLFHDTQVSVEKLRIQVGNKLSAMERGEDHVDSPVVEALNRLYGTLDAYEHEFEEMMAWEAEENFTVYNSWLRHVKGIGPALASQLLAMLLPPLEDRGPSTWYKAAGLTVEVIDGKNRLPRPRVGGGKITYYPRLRRCLYNVATSLVRTGGYYREAYLREKERLTSKHAGDDANWPKHRLDAAARWAMIKLFLSHLYEQWLLAEGKTGRKAYVVEVLGHTYIEPPQVPAKGKI